MNTLFISIVLVLSVFSFIVILKKELKMKHLLEEKEKLFQNTLHSEYEIFRITSSYEKIKQIIEQDEKERKCFNYNELLKLKKDISISFSSFSNELQIACPTLSPDEIIFCCLLKAKIPLIVIMYCLGNNDISPLKQRKYRIHQKMLQCRCEKLFDSIFTKKR
jgi:hypothetical protein